MIKIDFHKKIKTDGDCLNAKQCRKLAKLCLEKLAANMLESTIEVYIVPRKKIAEINHNLRQVSGETDVLSFPQNFPPEAREKVLGTIFIAPEVAKERRESCEKLFIHGMLHLLGFDHEIKPRQWEKAEKIIKGKNDLS